MMLKEAEKRWGLYIVSGAKAAVAPVGKDVTSYI